MNESRITGRLERALARGPAAPAPPDHEALVERATAAGIADVAFGTVDSPLGTLLVAATPRGLVRVAYLAFEGGEPAVLEELAADVSPRVLRAPPRVDGVRRELDEYFEGRRHAFDVPVDWAPLRGFRRAVLRSTARIPYGVVRTYADVAAAAGSPRGARAAGNALGSNPVPIVVPCHRVVAAGHRLGGYTGGVDKKEFLLSLEGATL